MKVYKGASASPGLVLGQVSRLERHVETFSDGPFNPEREQRMLDEAFARAADALLKLPRPEYIDLLASLAAENGQGGEALVFSAADRDTVGQAVVDAANGKKPGVVVKPKTPASAVLPFIDKVELILVMTVEPGFGGQKFMADMMPKVAQLRAWIDEKNPACELEVDGGVDPATCKICVASGANVLVAGSAVYKAADIPARIRELRG